MVIDGPVDVVEFRLLVRGTVIGCGLGRVSPPAPYVRDPAELLHIKRGSCHGAQGVRGGGL